MSSAAKAMSASANSNERASQSFSPKETWHIDLDDEAQHHETQDNTTMLDHQTAAGDSQREPTSKPAVNIVMRLMLVPVLGLLIAFVSFWVFGLHFPLRERTTIMDDAWRPCAQSQGHQTKRVAQPVLTEVAHAIQTAATNVNMRLTLEDALQDHGTNSIMVVDTTALTTVLPDTFLQSTNPARVFGDVPKGTANGTLNGQTCIQLTAHKLQLCSRLVVANSPEPSSSESCVNGSLCPIHVYFARHTTSVGVLRLSQNGSVCSTSQRCRQHLMSQRSTAIQTAEPLSISPLGNGVDVHLFHLDSQRHRSEKQHDWTSTTRYSLATEWSRAGAALLIVGGVLFTVGALYAGWTTSTWIRDATVFMGKAQRMGFNAAKEQPATDDTASCICYRWKELGTMHLMTILLRKRLLEYRAFIPREIIPNVNNMSHSPTASIGKMSSKYSGTPKAAFTPRMPAVPGVSPTRSAGNAHASPLDPFIQVEQSMYHSGSVSNEEGSDEDGSGLQFVIPLGSGDLSPVQSVRLDKQDSGLQLATSGSGDQQPSGSFSGFAFPKSPRIMAMHPGGSEVGNSLSPKNIDSENTSCKPSPAARRTSAIFAMSITTASMGYLHSAAQTAQTQSMLSAPSGYLPGGSSAQLKRRLSAAVGLNFPPSLHIAIPGTVPNSARDASAESPVNPEASISSRISGIPTQALTQTPQGSSIQPLPTPTAAASSSPSDHPPLDLLGAQSAQSGPTSTFHLMKKVSVLKIKFAPADAVGSSYPFTRGTWEKAQDIIAKTLNCGEQFHSQTVLITAESVTLSWNALKPFPFHEVRALLCAVHIASQLEDIGRDISWSIAVSTGMCSTGTFGTKRTMKQCVQGDAVLAVDCVVDLGLMLRCNIVTTDSSYSVARSHISCMPIDFGFLNGANFTLYEVRGLKDVTIPHLRYVKKGLAAMTTQNYELASRHFGDFLSRAPNASMERQVSRLARFCNDKVGSDDIYMRMGPAWTVHEVAADNLELPEAIEDELLALEQLHQQRRSSRRRSSINPVFQLRAELERTVYQQQSTGSDDELRVAMKEAVAEVEAEREARSPTHSYKSDDVVSSPLYRAGSVEMPPALRQSLLITDGDTSNFVGIGEPRSPSIISPMGVGSPRIRITSPTFAVGSDAGLFTPKRQSLGRAASTDMPDNVIIDHRGNRFIKSNKVIGRGTFGEVHVGMLEDGSLCAIKTMQLPPSTLNNSGCSPNVLSKEVEDLLTEVGTLSKIHNEHIVKYYSSAVVRGECLAIVMEYVSGGSLAKVLSCFGAVSLSSAMRYAKDILEGLRSLHEMDIMHRDIGPNNVLLTIDGTCKLSDFGCSTTLERLNGVVAGTPHYMAPEACRGHPLQASDIWSVGIMMCVLLTGQLPFPPDSLQPVEAFMQRLGNDEGFTPLLPTGPQCGLNQDAREFIDECTRRDPAERPTAAALLHHPFVVG